MNLSLIFVILADCGMPPTIARATVRPGETTEGAVRTYICDADTKAKGDPTINCQNNGQWTISTLTCESKRYSHVHVYNYKIFRRCKRLTCLKHVFNIEILFFAVSVVVPPEETLPPGSGKLPDFHFRFWTNLSYRSPVFYSKLFFEKKCSVLFKH